MGERQRSQQQNQLPQLLAHEPHSLPIRLDIIMLGAVNNEHTRNLTCMQSYRMTQDIDSQRMDTNDGVADFYWPPAPSCVGPNRVQYRGFLIQVLDAEYLATMVLRLVFFDAEEGVADQSQAGTATRSIGSPVDHGDDALVTTPAQGRRNLWVRVLFYVWETMSMAKVWRDAYYDALARGAIYVQRGRGRG